MPWTWEFLQWHLNPVALQIGPLAIHWYGLMYAVAFVVSYALVAHRLKTERWEFVRRQIDDALTWMVLGILIGGRLGYVVFYGRDYFSQHLLEIILPFSLEGGFHFTGLSGMSFHGGFAGFALAVFLYCRKAKLSMTRFADLIAPAIPLGYAFGRLGNFINGELWGRITQVPWAIRFPLDPAGESLPDRLPPLRHPSQLYEAVGEGVFLWLVMWSLRKSRFAQGRMTALYLVGYGAVRFLIEFTREPDVQIGFVLGPLSMGQILCATMILTGIVLMLIPRGRSILRMRNAPSTTLPLDQGA